MNSTAALIPAPIPMHNEHTQEVSSFPPEYITLFEELAALTSSGVTKVLQIGPDNFIEKLQVTNPDATVDVVSIRRFPHRAAVSEICIEKFANKTTKTYLEKRVYELIRDASGTLVEIKNYLLSSVE